MALSMSRRGALIAGAGAAALPALGLPRAARAATAWSAYTYVPVGTVVSVRGMHSLMDQFTKDTNGAVTAQIHLGGSLPISGTNITQAVSQNIVQFAEDGLSTGNIPIIGVLRLPMLLLSVAEMIKAMAIAGPYMEKAYAAKRCVMIGQFTYPPQVIWGHKKIASLADLAGKKIRVTSVEQGEFIKRFGGTPITMSPSQIAPAMEEGVIDGAITASSGGAIGLEDLLHWRFGIPTSFVNSAYIVSQTAFDRLTPDQQADLRKLGASTSAWANGEFERQEVLETDKFKKDGMNEVAASQADIDLAVSKLKDYWPQWAKAHGPEAEELLGKIRAAVGR